MARKAVENKVVLLAGLLWAAISIIAIVCGSAAAADSHHESDSRAGHDRESSQPRNDNDSRLVDPKTGETRAIINQDRYDGHYDVRDPKTGELLYRIDRDCYLSKCK